MRIIYVQVALYPLQIFSGSDNSVWYFNSTTPSANSPASNQGPTAHSKNVGAIAGGTIAGVLFLIAIVFFAYCIGKSHGRKLPPL
jgi:hypothetical protein